MSTITIYPTGDGDVANLSARAPTTPTTNWDKVDDPAGTPDDGTTNLLMNPSPTYVLFTFAAPTIPVNATIDKVSVHFRAYNWTGYPAQGAVRVNGTRYFSADIALTTSFANYVRDFTTNPATGAAWTIADLNGSGASPLQQFGVAGNTYGHYLTQAYLTVDFTQDYSAGGAGGAGSGEQTVVAPSGSGFSRR